MTEQLAEFAAEYQRRGAGAVMWEMITGYRISRIVRVAAALSLAEHCADGPVSAEQIAGLESADVTATARFLRASAAIGLVRCVDGPRGLAAPHRGDGCRLADERHRGDRRLSGNCRGGLG